MTAKANLKLGVTLHSFTSEYITYKWSLEDLFQLTSVLGGGLEIVGPAHQRGYPYLTDEFERLFKSSVERWGLTPTSYGTYADPFMLKDRDLNPDEMVDYIVPQLKSAAKLGFTIARLQYFSFSVIERLLPWAERLNLKLGYELHVPLMIKSARTQALLEQIERIGSPWLGLIPDTGIFARSIPAFRLAATRAAGVGEELVQRAITLWNAKTPDHDALAELLKMGLRKQNIANIEMIWGSFGQSDPEELKDILPHVIHIHGKFFSMKDGEEPDVRFEEVVKVLVESGYDGWISSEYEGQGGVDTFGLVSEQQAMIRRYAAKYAPQ
jgi:sugar phosphate isomerase/epimerase